MREAKKMEEERAKQLEAAQGQKKDRAEMLEQRNRERYAERENGLSILVYYSTFVGNQCVFIF